MRMLSMIWRATCWRWPGIPLVVTVALTACTAPEPRPAADSMPSTQVYFFPAQGQGADRQERDRYECYLWARKQTGFDPSLPELAPHQRLEFVPAASAGQDSAPEASSDGARREKTPPHSDRRVAQRYEQAAVDYRRAMTACLEGRGYTVR